MPQAPTAGARERALVRAPLLTVSAMAWLLLAVEWLSTGATMHRPAGITSLLAGWLLMLTAMMTPLLPAPVRHIYERSFARRRARLLTLFLSGYAFVWLVVGVVLYEVAERLLRLGPGMAIVTAAAVALVWHTTPLKGRCLNRVHAHPVLPAFGRPSELGALRFGLVHGAWCAGTCWALMLVPLVAGGAEPLAMVAAALWLSAERFEPPAPPRWGFRFPTQGARATWCARSTAPACARRTGESEDPRGRGRRPRGLSGR